eukprot:CAMPEP_0202710604 /NCGR_PEP_ID=MMETSP1385-20130828/22563_1 /ASSEMBLY_ACC=CAM_ASM_000861 /TAXON_ID=933848 /ORGANISM="Elphidium margaritaceum" /LENGTH=652 /DNA_ID=CAMNT_0049370175 /DNA_START=71 /DNA_END=2029 /DNA_ORIENTATION=+
MKTGSNLHISMNGYVMDCDYSTELYRFAAAESISKRQAHRMLDLKVGAWIDVNPVRRHFGWKPADVRQLDEQSGQVQVMYHHGDKNYIHYAHLDDENEIAEFATKSAIANPATDAVSTDQQMIDMAIQESLNVDIDAIDSSDMQRILLMEAKHEEESLAPAPAPAEANQQPSQAVVQPPISSNINNANDPLLVNEDVVNQLVTLGFDREECIRASSLVVNYDNIDTVTDKVLSMREEAAAAAENADNHDPASQAQSQVQLARASNKMREFISELQELIGILQKRLDFMSQQDSVVEERIASSSSKSLLQSAKQRAVKTEKDLLEQIMSLHEINTFLNDIILIENMFNAGYTATLRQEQQDARRRHARNIEVYENKAKPQSEIDSFVELLFAGTNLHIGEFRSFLNLLRDYCLKSKINICELGEAKGKSIERAFYKAFYVYGMHSSDGFKQMTDVLRCSLLFDNFYDLYKCWNMIEILAKQGGGQGILRCKDRFNPEKMPFGYRDILINIYCPNSKIVCEIQLHHKLFYQHKKVSHALYKKARLFEQNETNLAYSYADKHNRKHVGDRVYKVDGAAGDQKQQDEKEEDSEVIRLLREWRLDHYSGKLIDEFGYTLVEDWQALDEPKLQTMGFKEGEAKRFVKKVQDYQQGSGR